MLLSFQVLQGQIVHPIPPAIFSNQRNFFNMLLSETTTLVYYVK